MPKRVMHTLEGESLLNDASGLVCFRFAVAAALTGMFSLPSAALVFVQLAAVGVALGVGLTYGIVWAKNWISRRFGEESGSQVVITLLIPFIAYQAAEHFGGSGILAAVAAGITMSYAELAGGSLASTLAVCPVEPATSQVAIGSAAAGPAAASPIESASRKPPRRRSTDLSPPQPILVPVIGVPDRDTQSCLRHVPPRT